MDIERSLTQGKPKADISFYMAFNDRKNHHIALQIIAIFKALIFAIFIPINIYVYSFHASDSLMMKAMIVNLSSSLYEVMFLACSFNSIFGSVLLYLNIAEKTKHSVPQEMTTDFSTIQNCSSTTIFYAQSSLKLEDCNEATKKLLLNVTTNTIMQTIRLESVFFGKNESLSSTFSFLSMILSIVALADESLNVQNKTVLAVYVVLVGLSEIKTLLGCIIFALSPLLCLGLIIYCCFCKASQQQSGKYISLPIKTATTNDIMNAGGDCSICFQSIVLNDNIYVLSCSDKHIFHVTCLRHWAKVKSNCPICRHEIQMTNDKNSQPYVEDVIPNESNGYSG